MLRNVGDGRIDVIHNGHAQLIIQILGVKVLRRGGHTVDDGRGARVQMQLHRGDAGSGAGIDKAGLQHRQNCAATSLWTSSASSALQTLGRLVLAFSTISTAISRSAALST